MQTGAFEVRLSWSTPDRALSAAQSVSIDVNSARASVLNRATATNASVRVPLGNDVFVAQAWSGQNATGTVLGTARIPRTLTASSPRTLGIALGGIAADIVVGPAGGEKFVENLGISRSIDGKHSAFALVGPEPETFVAALTNAQGEALIESGSSPVEIEPVTRVLIDARKNADGSYVVAPRRLAQPGGKTYEDVLVRDRVDPALAFRLRLRFFSSLYVTDVGNQQVEVFDENGMPITSFAVDLTEDSGIAFDPFNGYLYLGSLSNPGSLGGGSIAVYDLNGNTINVPGTFPNADNPVGFAFDAYNRTLYVSNYGGPVAITAYDESGNTASGFSDGLPYAIQGGIAWDFLTNVLYIRNDAAFTIAAFNPNGTVHPTPGGFPGDTGNFVASPIAFNGNTAELLSPGGFKTLPPPNVMNVYTQQGDPVTLFAGTYPSLTAPTSVAVDQLHDNTFVGNCNEALPHSGTGPIAGSILRYDAGGANITPQGAFPGVNCPTGIAVVHAFPIFRFHF